MENIPGDAFEDQTTWIDSVMRWLAEELKFNFRCAVLVFVVMVSSLCLEEERLIGARALGMNVLTIEWHNT